MRAVRRAFSFSLSRRPNATQSYSQVIHRTAWGLSLMAPARKSSKGKRGKDNPRPTCGGLRMTAADVLVEVLESWGVKVIFGLPGDGINGIMEALRQRQGKIRFIQVRHEESAAFMACGYAKYTGRLGVCLATSGPGGIHLLNGLYDAKLDGQPVLAITGH